jgi:phospholipid-binding lipoprotein MlaA
MKVTFHFRAIFVAIGWGLAIAFSAVADSASAVEPASKALEMSASPQTSILDETGHDPLFDDDWNEDEDSFNEDPFEGSNRAVFKFNRGFHRVILRPLTWGYRAVVPKVAREGLRRALLNLSSPSIFINDLLQLRFKDAGQTLGRFVLNTSLGVAGIFDVGVEAGWEYKDADFGQTLANMGVGSGPYLVLPLLGPNTVRDGVGDVVDVLFRPLTYLIGPSQMIALGGGVGFTEFEARGAEMSALEQSSVDYYAALRSAYLQSHAAQLRSQDHYSQ